MSINVQKNECKSFYLRSKKHTKIRNILDVVNRQDSHWINLVSVTSFTDVGDRHPCPELDTHFTALITSGNRVIKCVLASTGCFSLSLSVSTKQFIVKSQLIYVKTVSNLQTGISHTDMWLCEDILDMSPLGLLNYLETWYKVLYSTSEHSSCNLCMSVYDPLTQFSQSFGSTAQHFVLQLIPGEVIAQI